MRQEPVGDRAGLQPQVPTGAGGSLLAWLQDLLHDSASSRSSLEFLRFSVVGLSGVAVNLGLYLVLTRAFSLSMHLASPLAIEASVFSNFLLNNTWTFRHRLVQAPLLWRLGRFHAVSGLGGVVNYAVLVVMVHVFGWSDVVANLAGIAAGVAVTFTMHSAWTWRERIFPRSSQTSAEGD